MPVVVRDQVEYCFGLFKNGDKLADVINSTNRAVQSLRGLTSGGDKPSNNVKQSIQRKDVQKYKAGY